MFREVDRAVCTNTTAPKKHLRSHQFLPAQKQPPQMLLLTASAVSANAGVRAGLGFLRGKRSCIFFWCEEDQITKVHTESQASWKL